MRLILIIFLLLATQAQGAPRYLSTNGSDSNDGSSWSQSWLTLSKAVANWSGGDTLIVGDGVWRESIDSVQSGTYGERTVIIDSAWLDSEAGPLAWIYGSELISGWDLSSGNIYKHYYTGTVVATYGMFQADSLIWRQTSLVDVTEEGEWYWNGTDTMYLWAVGGGDPDNYEIEYATRNWIDCQVGTAVGSAATDYFSIVGMGFKYGWDHGISMYSGNESTDLGCDSVFVDHNTLSHLAGQGDGNPCLIWIGHLHENTNSSYNNRVRANDMSNVWSMNPTTLQPYGGGAWGSATCFYDHNKTQVDSNYVHGYFANSGIYFKGGHVSGTDFYNDSATVAFNHIDINSTGIRLYSEYRWHDIYGNTIENCGTGILMEWGRQGTGTPEQGLTRITNNTFYGCDEPIFHANGQADSWSTRDWARDDTIKYNIFYGTNMDITYDSIPADNGPFFDYNMYFDNGTLEFYHHAEGYGWPWTDLVTQTYWTNTALNDVNSSFSTDPAFNSAGTGDFSRPSASGELDYTIDGFDFTISGAVQNASDPDPVVEQISGKVILSGKVK